MQVFNLANEMHGDFSKWISTPDDCPLPPLKYLDDDAIESIIHATKSISNFRSKDSIKKSRVVVLVTDSLDIVSSTDTFNHEHKNDDVESSGDESFHFDQCSSAFSYYSTPNESIVRVTSDIETQKDRKESDANTSNISSVSRKCVSCPNAAHISSTDFESVFKRPSIEKVSRSLEDTLLRKYKQEDASQGEYDTGTTTLDSIDVECHAMDAAENVTSRTNTESSIGSFSEEDSVNYDDDCSRVSYVSVYRSSPVEEVCTEGTAASLEIMTGSIRLTYINPASFPARPGRSPARKQCRTCRLDGLKYHPACPASEPRPRSSLDASRTLFDTCELLVVANSDGFD